MFINRGSIINRGFTLIEIMVVLVIVSILISLIIPAVQYAREVSRRVSCVNNLKQIGIALNNYEAVHKVYPQGTNGYFFSGQAMLLPFMELTTTYNSINFNVTNPIVSFADQGANFTSGNVVISLLCCPSDPDSMKTATTNYAWNGGLGYQATSFVGTFASAATQNLFYVKPSDIIDGLSSTAAMTEWKVGHYNSSDDVSVVFSVTIKAGVNYKQFVVECDNASRQATEFGSWTKNAEWFNGNYSSSLLNFNSTPNSPSCLYGRSLDFGNWPASSYHSNGVNVLFHDNHISFYNNNISLAVWNSLSTKSGNEVY